MADALTFESHSEEATRALGQHMAAAMTTGLTVALNGQLGSGKTNLVRAVCGGLGADESKVNSPTFVLMQAYMDGRLPVVHFDTYRLSDVDEFLAIGGEDYLLGTEAVCFVEWAERIVDILPADYLHIDIDQTAAQSRRFQFRSSGPVSDRIIERLRCCLQRPADSAQ